MKPTRRKLIANDDRVYHKDGKLAHSKRSIVLREERLGAKKLSRVQKVLGSGDTFSEEFKRAFAIETEHEQILERVHLENELDAAKKIINALRQYPSDPVCSAILGEIKSKPTYRTKDCVLCPIWRHENESNLGLIARSRYVFPRIHEELYLLTVVFDFAENLEALEMSLSDAHRSLQKLAAHLGRKRCGAVMLGTFECDLKSNQELCTEAKSTALMKEIGKVPPDSGGWTLTGHFFLRIPHREIMEEWLRREYPSSNKNWNRVRFDTLNEDKGILEQLFRILSYSGKLPSKLFKPPARETVDKKREAADAEMNNLSKAFHGLEPLPNLDPSQFNLNAAIVQWAKFVHSVGSKQIFYSVETTHAQKWLSETELDLLRSTDDDLFEIEHWDTEDKRMKSSTVHPIEIHRDRQFISSAPSPERLTKPTKTFRSRRLKYDPSWSSRTDCTDIDLETNYHDFNSYLLKQ